MEMCQTTFNIAKDSWFFCNIHYAHEYQQNFVPFKYFECIQEIFQIEHGTSGIAVQSKCRFDTDHGADRKAIMNAALR